MRRARLLLVGGAATAMLGVGLLVPALVERQERGLLPNLGVRIVLLAAALFVCGAAAIASGLRHREQAAIPAPVRATLTANVLFLAFCAMETSDGLLRQQGRVFYWTTVLFLPAAVLLGGMVMGRFWAWWAARGLAAVFTAWFVAFLALIPFADLRGSSGPVPWSGRVYMLCVTLVFAAISASVFRALGRPEARDYFRP